jgi:hypothetical protein
METVHETLGLMDELEVEKVFGLVGVRILPHTEIHRHYAATLRIADLLQPTFYMSEKVHYSEILAKFEGSYKLNNPGWTII